MPKDHPKLLIGSRISRFRIRKHIGAGGFGEIYAVLDEETQEMYAMKTEGISSHKSPIKLEIKILKELGGSKYFPRLIDSGKTHNIRYYVMELLGASLQNMRHIAPRKHFTMYTTLRIALESLKTIEEFHKHGYVHRDIKPGNFLIRDDPDYPICLIDFGLCRKFINEETNEIIPPRDEPGFTGTCRYASVNAHNFMELGRRDDIISWVYTIVELGDSRLPWPGTKDKERTKKMKKDISTETLLSDFPDEFLDIYRDVQKLNYEDEPNYEMYKKLLMDALSDMHPKRKGFDWEYYRKHEIEEVMPNLAQGQPKQASAASLSSTKAILGPPRKPFVIPEYIPPVYQPKPVLYNVGDPRAHPPPTPIRPSVNKQLETPSKTFEASPTKIIQVTDGLLEEENKEDVACNADCRI